MILLDIIAVLSNEPFNLSMEQIKRLTLFQIYRVLCRSRDKYGNIRPTRLRQENVSKAQQFREWCRNYKCPCWRAIELYGNP